ncbi:MbcA/ParS/Xre antitoxin family protein [Verrucomicrobiales bacterium]|nr:MbcA/ParS/Xre antitoxin family protein [Verrucomicrobiales bacterium]
MQIVADHAAPDVFTPSAGRVALKGFFSVAERWNLSVADQRVLLGGIPKSTFHTYKKLPEVALGRDFMERISLVLGIYKALRILIQSAEHADDWIHRDNDDPPFNGQTALVRMTAGSITDLYEVRTYLDAQRGW